MKNIEDGIYRHFHAHEKNTLLDGSELVCTKDDLTELKDIINKTDVIELCIRERMITTWGCFKLTNLFVFATLQRRHFTQASIEKLCNQLSHV